MRPALRRQKQEITESSRIAWTTEQDLISKIQNKKVPTVCEGKVNQLLNNKAVKLAARARMKRALQRK